MKILIAGAPDKYFHLKEFGEELKKHKIEYTLVNDSDYATGISKKNINEFLHPKKKFNELIKKEKPDVIFADRRTNFGIYAIESKIPLCLHLRGDIWSEAKWGNENLSLVQKIAENHRRNVIWDKNFKGSSLILPICKHLEKIVKEKYPNKETAVMYQGITSDRWYPEEGTKLKHPCVGLLQGAVIWGKAQEMLILEKVLKEMPDVTFYWVGDGPYREKILPVLEKYDNFKWLGALQYPDKVRQYLTEIDVYALVSGIDMSPLTLLEAQLMKKPVVATNVGGIPELMKDNETGFLVQKGNSEELIEKLLLLLNDKQKRENMGNMGRKFVEENFSWNKIAKEFVKDLKKIIVIKKKNVNLND
jgi:glycosyltransferase involved in cell wall biosynthesis